MSDSEQEMVDAQNETMTSDEDGSNAATPPRVFRELGIAVTNCGGLDCFEASMHPICVLCGVCSHELCLQCFVVKKERCCGKTLSFMWSRSSGGQYESMYKVGSKPVRPLHMLLEASIAKETDFSNVDEFCELIRDTFEGHRGNDVLCGAVRFIVRQGGLPLHVVGLRSFLLETFVIANNIAGSDVANLHSHPLIKDQLTVRLDAPQIYGVHCRDGYDDDYEDAYWDAAQFGPVSAG